MRVIIAGPRDIYDYELVAAAVQESGFAITEVVSGGATGIDALGEVWAKANKIPVKRFPADWKKLGKAAGPIRNEAMAVYSGGLVAVWNGISIGTGDMIRRAKRHSLAVYVKMLKDYGGKP